MTLHLLDSIRSLKNQSIDDTFPAAESDAFGTQTQSVDSTQRSQFGERFAFNLNVGDYSDDEDVKEFCK